MNKSYIVDSTCNDMRIDRWMRLNIGKIPQGLIEKYLRTNIKLSTILYFSTLVYFVFFIYSDIYLIEPIIDIPEIIDSLMFFGFCI